VARPAFTAGLQPAATIQTIASPRQGPTQTLTVNVESAITDAVAKVGPSVVTVVSNLQQTRGLGRSSQGGQADGSGVIISADGYIVTNNHVVEGAQSLQVVLADGTTLPAQLVGTDPFSDIAVIQVKGKLPAPASFGNSDILKPGETAIAIGSPLGDFKNTVTVGVISGTGRSIDTGDGLTLENMIQTDAAINHGNSGGPLVNLDGQVIAINTLVVRGNAAGGDVAEGLGFAIPGNTVKSVVDQIISKGSVVRPFLGVSWQWITPDIAQANGLSVQYGAYISSVASGGPAAKAGLQRGDIITAISGQALDNDHSFINVLLNYKPGDVINLTVFRGGQNKQLSLTLAERPSS
jgi:S1-C subfamily serine protease